jgi:hypothetical protein
MSVSDLTANQRRTAPARAAFDARFSTPEERSEHFRRIGQRGNHVRVTLTAAEAAALAEAFRLLSGIAARLPAGADGDDR